jgi:hypothetical protein
LNIGNNSPVELGDFIRAIETSCGKTAVKNLMPMQAGDVPATWADTSLLHALTQYNPPPLWKRGWTTSCGGIVPIMGFNWSFALLGDM